VGSHGVLVGNDQSGSMTELALARGEYRLRVFVDAETTRNVSRVVFALSEQASPSAQRPPTRSIQDQRPRTAALNS
jgi:hypothetical protein